MLIYTRNKYSQGRLDYIIQANENLYPKYRALQLIMKTFNVLKKAAEAL